MEPKRIVDGRLIDINAIRYLSSKNEPFVFVAMTQNPIFQKVQSKKKKKMLFKLKIDCNDFTNETG